MSVRSRISIAKRDGTVTSAEARGIRRAAGSKVTLTEVTSVRLLLNDTETKFESGARGILRSIRRTKD
jgi:hypothetical protein